MCVWSKVREIGGFYGRCGGIEIDPSKVKAICELRPPTSIEEHYLTHSLVLVPPTPGIPLILYLTIHKESLGAVLVQKRPSDEKECTIYYLAKKFTDSKALLWVLHRLRQYTLHHQIPLVTEYNPIKYPLEKPALIGKLAKWQIFLSKFDIQSMTQKSAKGHAIGDMLAENSMGLEIPHIDPLDDRVLLITTNKWTMYFDGAINLLGSGTGAVLISLDGQDYPIAARLIFPCTNNIAEYEACILGLQTAIDMGIRRL
ncbi:uncharacterized protein LOC125312824 [Rhodamnia argentea]|uniref:Uncharacterized protein LOC125312824 n=1 Tax=Rhodamnia argentea TaxID=178133 RepID=A0ABM3GVM7_9MYRT|nr:uncharacterized protein LOC125312824 [Rhodamnia argentea]